MNNRCCYGYTLKNECGNLDLSATYWLRVEILVSIELLEGCRDLEPVQFDHVDIKNYTIEDKMNVSNNKFSL